MTDFITEVVRKLMDTKMAFIEKTLRSFMPDGATSEECEAYIAIHNMHLNHVMDDEWENPNERTQLWAGGELVGEFVRWYEKDHKGGGTFHVAFEQNGLTMTTSETLPEGDDGRYEIGCS